MKYSSDIASTLLEDIQRTYPMIQAVRWNKKKDCFEIFEETTKGATRVLRRVMDYANEDGSAFPFVAHQAVRLLKRADTRLWPLEERMALFDKEDEKAEEKRIHDAHEEVRTRIIEDYHYIAGIPTFFFGEGMKVARATRRGA